MYLCMTLVVLLSNPVKTTPELEHNPQTAPEGSARACPRPLRSDEAEVAATGAPPIEVTLEVPQGSILPGENFPIRLTVHNPHPYAIYFRHIGYEQPRLYAAIGEEEFCYVGRAGGVNPDAVIAPLLEPNESVTAQFLIFLRLTGLNRFTPKRECTLRLRAGGAMSGFKVDGREDERVVLHCTSNEVRIPVRIPTSMEEQARAAVRKWHDETLPQMTKDLIPWEQERTISMEFYRSFLERFGDTPYGKEVRLVLGLLVREHLEAHRKDNQVVEECGPLLMDCVSKCLDYGPAYAAVVSRELLEQLAIRGDWEHFIKVIEALLRFAPQDRTVDRLLTELTRQGWDIDRMQRRMGLPQGPMTERVGGTVLSVVERSLSWNGYRAIGYEERVFPLLVRFERWDLLERAALRTLEVADRERAAGAAWWARHTVQDKDLQAAKAALEKVRAMKDSPKPVSDTEKDE